MNRSSASALFLSGIALICGALAAVASPPALALKTICNNQIISPVAITNAADGSKRIFVCDQIGKIWIIQDEMVLPTPFLDISSEIVPFPPTSYPFPLAGTNGTGYDERGMLSVAFHPGFANPASPGYKKFYVFYSAPSPNPLGNSVPNAISLGNPCTITTTAAHGLNTGDVVTLTGIHGGTFDQPIDATYSVTRVDATHFTVPVECTSNTGISFAGSRVFANNPVNCRSTVSEFQVTGSNPNVADRTSERVVMSWDKPQNNHNGGQLAFSPVDGYLYITVGDGGSQHDNDYGHTGGNVQGGTQVTPTGNLGNAQDLTKLLGKILRIDPLGNNGPGGAYGIPSDNPFVGLVTASGASVRGEIFTYGMRNPWRLSFDTDPNTLITRLFEGDVGQDNVEEVNLIVSGGNYGWRIMEGTFAHDSTAPTGGSQLNPPVSDTLINPIAEYAHVGTNLTNYPGLTKIGSSVIGGYVYRGGAIPALVGEYVFAEYSAIGTGSAAGPILLTLDAGTWALSEPTVVGTQPVYIQALGPDESGELYVAAKTAQGPTLATNPPSGIIYKIVAAQTFTISLAPNHDNTIFSESSSLSNALGDLFAGVTASGNKRRALVMFDIAGNLPAGAAIASAQLTLNMDNTAATAPASMSLFKLSQNWGEGTSGPSNGAGATATVGDATWNDRLWDPTTPTLWGTPPNNLKPGGQYVLTASAATSVGTATGPYIWSSASSPQMAADVQSWLTTPATNFGWLLHTDDETTTTTVREFNSRESATNVQPSLQITYAVAPALTWRETWLQTYFAPAIAGFPTIGKFVDDAADANGNGASNLLEYAWATNPVAPLAANSVPPGVQTTVTSSGENTTYTMTFLRDSRAVDLTYQLQTSNDLVNWTTIVQSAGGAVPSGSGFVSEVDAPGQSQSNVKTVTAVETLATPTKHFSRLIVTRSE